MIDLTKLQNRYRVTFEESYYYAGTLDRADPDFPLMYQIIAGRYGEIYNYDDEHLAVYVIGEKRHKEVSRLDGIQLLNDCDGEGVYLFKVDNLELLYTIAEIIHAHKKRRLSEEQKTLQVKRLREYRVKKQIMDTQISLKFTQVNACPENKKP
jgi:hypothetical protein